MNSDPLRWLRAPRFEDPKETRLAAVSHWIFTNTAAVVLGASVLALFQSMVRKGTASKREEEGEALLGPMAGL
jgi:hypothetical protein